MWAKYLTFLPTAFHTHTQNCQLSFRVVITRHLLHPKRTGPNCCVTLLPHLFILYLNYIINISLILITSQDLDLTHSRLMSHAGIYMSSYYPRASRRWMGAQQKRRLVQTEEGGCHYFANNMESPVLKSTLLFGFGSLSKSPCV